MRKLTASMMNDKTITQGLLVPRFIVGGDIDAGHKFVFSRIYTQAIMEKTADAEGRIHVWADIPVLAKELNMKPDKLRQMILELYWFGYFGYPLDHEGDCYRLYIQVA